MPRNLRLSLIALAALLVSTAAGAVPSRLSYQGRLLKKDGTPETAGPISFTFKLFDSAEGGTAKWTEAQLLALTNGYYATFLGDDVANPFPADLFASGELFLELTIGSEAMSPRQPFASVPYAIEARNVRGGVVDASSVRLNGTPLFDSDGTLAAAARYSAGSGVSIDATRTIGVRLKPGGGLALENGALIVDTGAIGGSGANSYTAGTGISINGNVISVTGSGGATYAAGSGISIVDNVISSTVSSGPTYTAGTGISIVDNVISSTLSSGPTYTAGAGISINGSVISTDFSSLQSRITGNCPAGEVVSGLNADGTFICVALPSGSGGGVTAGSAGDGLVFANDRLNLPACAAGQYLRRSANNSWECTSDGSNLTALDASQLTSGSLDAVNRIADLGIPPTKLAAGDASSDFGVRGIFTAKGDTNLNSNVTIKGTLDVTGTTMFAKRAFFTQPVSVGAPSAVCSPGSIAFDSTTNQFMGCDNSNTWKALAFTP
jgi:hypothetical protein